MKPRPTDQLNSLTRLTIGFLFTFSAGFGQNLGSWNIVNGQYNISKTWSVFGEAQLRSLKFYSNFHYYEIKGGANFLIQPNVKLTLGAGTYQTYQEGGNFVTPKSSNEIRIWPQVSLLQSAGKFNIEHRYRAEFRFTLDGYKIRYRYRFGFFHPFGNMVDGHKRYQAGISSEIFFTNKEPYFERLRLAFTLNYVLSGKTSLQLGLVHQFDYKLTDETGRDFLLVGFYYQISGHRSGAVHATE